uniref:Uncharacterized protein MANES_01G178600 n=1 Tax=Rhizophora mucronata TaxID=61149 RepID=A0A2P2IQ23_RHIMU
MFHFAAESLYSQVVLLDTFLMHDANPDG